MENYSITGFPPNVRENLEKAGLVSSNTILLSSDHELRKLANLTTKECELVRSSVAESVTSHGFYTVADARLKLEEKWRRLSVGCSKLDTFLRGGIPVRGITEIAGESSSGKTQLCLQLALMVQYPPSFGGLGKGAVYICTEDAFPSRRLQELFKSFPSTFQRPPTDISFGDNIFIEHIGDVDKLKQCLSTRLPQLLRLQKIGLIVVDSVAGVFRADYDARDPINRAKDLQIVGTQLHELAKQFCVVVVCVNQVSDVVCSEKTNTNKRQPVAALGLAWANMVTTRLQLSRSHRTIPDSRQPELAVSVRMMQVMFAPDLPCSSCHFIVTGAGVSGVD